MVNAAVMTPEMTTKVVIPHTSVRTVRRGLRLPTSWLLFLGTLAIYCLTRTHLNTFDAVAYANQIGLAEQTGKLRPLFHPHHLLFNALGFGLWRLARFAGFGGGPLIINQSLNAVLGAWGVALLYGTLRRLQPVGTRPLLMSIGLAGSFGWWICATDGRVNMPSALLMLAAFGGIVRLRDRPVPGQAATVGLLAGLAVLFHESAGLFGLVGAGGVFLSAAGPHRLRMLLAYSITWVLVITTAYGGVGVLALHLHSASAFHHWMNAYAERGWWWDFHIIRNLRLDVFGLRHAVFAQPLGRAALAQTPLHPFGTAALCLLWLQYGLALVGLTASALSIGGSLPGLRRSADWPVAAVCLTWIGIYAAFFTVWCPGAFVFWVPVLVPLAALLLLSRPSPTLLSVWVGVFVLLNFLTGILPYLKPVAGVSQRLALDIQTHTPPRSLVVVSGVGDDAQCEVDIPYFADRPILSLHGILAHSSTLPAAQASLDKSLTAALGAGRQVYILDEIWSRRDQVKGLQRQSPTLTGETLHTLFQSYVLMPAWTGPRGLVWRLTPSLSRTSEARRRIGGDANRNADPAEDDAASPIPRHLPGSGDPRRAVHPRFRPLPAGPAPGEIFAAAV